MENKFCLQDVRWEYEDIEIRVFHIPTNIQAYEESQNLLYSKDNIAHYLFLALKNLEEKVNAHYAKGASHANT